MLTLSFWMVGVPVLLIALGVSWLLAVSVLIH
jgi:hypothetical protein